MKEKLHVPEHARPPELTELDSQATANLLYWSFYLSQGRHGIQTQIFRQVGRNSPNLRISETVKKEDVIGILLPGISRLVASENHLGIGDAYIQMLDVDHRKRLEKLQAKYDLSSTVEAYLVEQIDGEFSELNRLLARPYNDRLSHPSGLLFLILQRDVYFLTSDNGPRRRPAATGSRPVEGVHGAHLSHFIEYVLLNRLPAAIPTALRSVYENLQASIKDTEFMNALSRKTIRYIETLIAQRNESLDLSAFPALSRRLAEIKNIDPETDDEEVEGQ